jgi:hypothetical protein
MAKEDPTQANGSDSDMEEIYTEADARWNALLASEECQLVLEKLVDEALADIRVGKARPMKRSF